MSDQEVPEKSKLEQLKEARAAKRARVTAASEAQEAVDLEAIMDLEDEYGELAVVKISYDPNNPLPVLCAVRCPNPIEIKRYRDTVAPKRSKRNGESRVDPYAATLAAEALATQCLVYPPKDVHAKIREARPGVHAQLGACAIELSVGEAEAEGKD